MNVATENVTTEEFLLEALALLESCRSVTLSDNYDEFRFSFDGIDRSDSHDALGSEHFLEFLHANASLYRNAYVGLRDDASRCVFLRLIAYRALGHRRVMISDDLTMSMIRSRFLAAERMRIGVSPIGFTGALGALETFALTDAQGSELVLDVWPINVVYDLGGGGHRQYFFQRDDMVIRPEPGDVVIDGGACFGDTSTIFADVAGRDGLVLAFEPIPRHAQIARHNAAQNNLEEHVFVVEAGLGARSNGVLAPPMYINALADPGFSIEARLDEIPVTTIDETVSSIGLNQVDFIKLDVEGFELPALLGAAETIDRFRPKLAISAYHKWEDLFTLQNHLHAHWPDYEFYLDHYTVHSEETVLYAIHP